MTVGEQRKIAGKGRCVTYIDEPMCEGWYWYYLPEGKEETPANFIRLEPDQEIKITGNCWVFWDSLVPYEDEEFNKELWTALFDLGANIEIYG